MTSFSPWLWLFIVVASTTIAAPLLPAAEHSADSIVILPDKVTLTGARSSHRILAERVTAGRLVGLANGVSWNSDNDHVAVVRNERITPVGNGTAVITAQWEDKIAQCQVEVTGFEEPTPWEFGAMCYLRSRRRDAIRGLVTGH